MAKFEKLNINGVIKISANEGDVITVASGTFVSMSDTFNVSVIKNHDFKKTLEKAISRHKIVLEEYVATKAGELILADEKLGDAAIVEIEDGKTYIIERKEFIASCGDLTYETEGEGVKGLFSGEGVFRLLVKGTGIICLSAYGSLIEKELKAGESLMIDMDHIILRDQSLKYKVIDLEQTKQRFGEGKAARLEGPGKVWYQTQTANSFMTNPEL
ncbi:MAG: AIM24 family protein [Sarcina sp.]